MFFSKLKADLRKAAERTIPRLRRRIGKFARTLTAREAGTQAMSASSLVSRLLTEPRCGWSS